MTVKVAHLNTNMYGGAAIVARRIHRALLQAKVTSGLFTKYGLTADEPHHYYIKDAHIINFMRRRFSSSRLFGIAKFVKDMALDRHLRGRPKGFELFSPLDDLKVPQQFDLLAGYDVIHLHWINNLVGISPLLERFHNKRFIWTLHDMNPITGGCHHSDQCMKFVSGCHVCPQLKNTIDETYSHKIYRYKQAALSRIKTNQMFIVAPSHWLSELSQASAITGRFKHFVIPNPSFDVTPVILDKISTRVKLGLPLDKNIVLFSADNLNNPRKGIDTIFRAMDLIKNKNEILFVGIGNGAGNATSINIKYTGHIEDANLLASYYSSADLFVTASKAENSPLVVIEALTCGTPVVASSVGGIPELVTKKDGLLFSSGDSIDLSAKIELALLGSSFNREQIAAAATEKYHPSKVAANYLQLYSKLLNGSPS